METLEKIRVMGFWYTFFGGHISIGKVTIFGENAMQWSIVIHGTRWGAIHIDIPTFSRLFGKRTWCMYVSPNGTPWACTWYIGTSDPKENIRAQIRRFHFGHKHKAGHGYSEDGNKLYALNQKMDAILWRM